MVLTPTVRAKDEAHGEAVTVSLLTGGEPQTLDPNRATAANTAVVRQVFEPLLRFDKDLVPQPAAAQSYEVSLDGTVYTFHLRQDGRWSDGQPVTAGQFEYSWKRLFDPPLHADYAGLFQQAGIKSVTAPDDDTLRVQLEQPFGALPDLAALPVGAPLRRDIVGADPDGWWQDPSTYIGNGPFMVAEWVHGDHLTLVPNPNYAAHLNWPKPTLTRVTVPFETDAAADVMAFTTGARDWVLVPDADVNDVLNDPRLSADSRQFTALETFWLQMNSANQPLDNVLVRRALSKAVPRGAMLRQLATGLGLPTTSVIPPGMPVSLPTQGADLSFDPAGARALLQQAGFTVDAEPFPTLTFLFPDTPANLTRAQWLHDQLNANLGVDVDLNGVDEAAYEHAVKAGQYDLAFGGWQADYPDPQDWFGLLFGCKAAYNTFGYCDPAFDQLVARADTTANPTDRLELYAQAQTMLMQDVPVAPLFVRGQLLLAKPWLQIQVSAMDEYPGSLFLDEVQILPH